MAVNHFDPEDVANIKNGRDAMQVAVPKLVNIFERIQAMAEYTGAEKFKKGVSELLEPAIEATKTGFNDFEIKAAEVERKYQAIQEATGNM